MRSLPTSDAHPPLQHDLVVRARRAVVEGRELPVEVGVTGGVVVTVAHLGAGLLGRVATDLAADEVLLPGLVDTHVHVNEPGRTSWEGFATATRAAAAGGVTTLLDMPLNSIPATVDATALQVKREAARGQCHVDVGFWGGAVPGNVGALRGLHDAGVFGVKCFLLDSGVAEFPHLDPAGLEAALRELRAMDALMLVHAEDPDVVDTAPPAHGRGYAGFLRSRPNEAEDTAVATLVAAARRTGARAHVVHLSSADALPVIAKARRDGVRLSVETCPHYLTLTAEEVPDGATQFKCCPPIRGAANRDLLWAGLAAGTIDAVVSDHSPCTPDLKRLDTGDFGQAWGGVASLQVGLSAVWTEARRRGHGIEEVVRWMAQGPAELVGMTRKGRLAPGYDADLVVFAPEETWTVDPARLHHRNPATPYAGRVLAGVVRQTLLRGVPVTGDRPHGRLLSRGEA